jgi:hypothetical protein
MITKTFWQTRQTAETGEINGAETPLTEKSSKGTLS